MTRKGPICILCDKEVKSGEKKFVLAVETPVRINFIVHRHCYLNSDENTQKDAIKCQFN